MTVYTHDLAPSSRISEITTIRPPPYFLSNEAGIHCIRAQSSNIVVSRGLTLRAVREDVDCVEKTQRRSTIRVWTCDIGLPSPASL